MTRVEHLSEDVVLMLGDCAELLPTVGRVDAVVTDPPFGINDKPMVDLPGRGGRGNNDYHLASEWDASIDGEWPRLCEGITDVVAWFGHWRKRSEVEAAFSLPLRSEIVWAKDTHVGPPCPVAMRDERIWLFSKAGIKGATFETSVWDSPIIPTWGHKNHKNEKPIALMARLIRFLGPQTVCDPFMGSGSTGVACVQLGRGFTGIEREPVHFDIACRRISDELRRPRLQLEPVAKPVQQGLAL